MWKCRTVKKSGRANLKRCYWAAVMVCFLLAFVAGEFAESTDYIHQNAATVTNSVIMRHLGGGAPVPAGTEGNSGLLLLQVLFDQVTSSHDWLFRIFAGGLFILAAGLMVSFQFLIGNPLKVGARRFFWESRDGQKEFATLFEPFRNGHYLHIAWTMLCRDVLVSLGSLAVIPGLILLYSYRMVPFLLAEDPTLSCRDALRLSRVMMRGQKWHTFLLDCSFVGWKLLSGATFGLVGFFYGNPYNIAANAELYAVLRERVMAGAPALQGAVPAFQPMARPAVPAIRFPIRERYSATDYVLFFFSFSVVGWIWEVGLHIVQTGRFVNRGTMFGPWLPIYGAGAVLVLLLLRRAFRNPALTFLLSTLLCTGIEYFTSWVLEAATGQRWWDYSSYFMNLNGRVCLEGALVFGVGCCVAVYMAAPLLGRLYDRIPAKAAGGVCAVLLLAFASDGAYSHFHPNIGEGVTESRPASVETQGRSPS